MVQAEPLLCTETTVDVRGHVQPNVLTCWVCEHRCKHPSCHPTNSKGLAWAPATCLKAFSQHRAHPQVACCVHAFPEERGALQAAKMSASDAGLLGQQTVSTAWQTHPASVVSQGSMPAKQQGEVLLLGRNLVTQRPD